MTIDRIMRPAQRPTPAQTMAAMALTLVVAETIRESGEVPSGVLYAGLVGRVDLTGYGAIIRTLKNAGLVSETAHLLKWTGPEITK